ncbi:MAG: DUF1016 domain-containing protein, partial [Flavisolibacter sp.]|nr:DUF1016 domain-containing protein [Flavisolibacter sp.]
MRDALRPELSWTHYKLLLRVEDEAARNYYMEEAIAQNWSTRALERQINSFYYERIISSKNKKAVAAEAEENTESLAARPEDFIKDPYVLEFLNLPSGSGFLENETIVKYSVLKESKQLFASKYKLYLTTEEELKKEVEQELLHYQLEH